MRGRARPRNDSCERAPEGLIRVDDAFEVHLIPSGVRSWQEARASHLATRGAAESTVVLIASSSDKDAPVDT